MPGSGASFIDVHGVRVAVDGRCVSPAIRHALRTGAYERPEALHLPGIVEPGERIVELGGGLGFISSHIARLGRAECLTVYEADPRLVPLIEATHRLNGVEARVINAAALPEPDRPTAPFYVRADFWASSLSPEPYGYDAVIDVPAVAFGAILEAHRPTMLVVDIEGGEDSLFRNVSLQGVRKVYLELHQAVIGRAGMKRLFDFFSERNFHYDQWHSSQAVVLFSHVLRDG